MGNARSFRRKRQKKSLKQRTEAAEESLQRASQAMLQLRADKRELEMQLAQAQDSLTRMQALIAAAALEYGHYGELELSQTAVEDLANVTGFDWYRDEETGAMMVSLFFKDHDEGDDDGDDAALDGDEGDTEDAGSGDSDDGIGGLGEDEVPEDE